MPVYDDNCIVIQPEPCRYTTVITLRSNLNRAGIWWPLHCNPTWTVPVFDGHYIVIQPESCRYMMAMAPTGPIQAPWWIGRCICSTDYLRWSTPATNRTYTCLVSRRVLSWRLFGQCYVWSVIAVWLFLSQISMSIWSHVHCVVLVAV